MVVILKPGERESFHHHARSCKLRVYRSTTLRYHTPDGRYRDISKRVVSVDQPLVEQLEPESLHALEHLSKHDTYYALHIEFKRHSPLMHRI
jgi:hypothetical protein